MLLLINAVATICTTNVYMAPHTKKANRCSFTTPLFNLEKVQKLSSPWRGPYKVLKCLNDVNYKIKDVTTGKVQVVHYDRMKRYYGPIPVASNVQTRRTTHPTGYHTSPVPDFDH